MPHAPFPLLPPLANPYPPQVPHTTTTTATRVTMAGATATTTITTVAAAPPQQPGQWGVTTTIVMDIWLYSLSFPTKNLNYSFSSTIYPDYIYLLRFYLKYHLLSPSQFLLNVGNMLGTHLECVWNTFLIWKVTSKHFTAIRISACHIILINTETIYIRIFLG